MLFRLSLLTAQADEPGVVPHFEFAACWFDLPPGETIVCGYLTVPENRAKPNGRAIRLAVAIVKSHNPTPAPDPIIYLRGGLGRPTRWFIEHELNRIDSWLARRDVVLFDQRGLDMSQPALDCPEVNEVVLQEWLGANLSIEAQLAPRLACRDRWLAQNIDLTAYNSFETAADVANLWQALGYKQVNLIGASYWTIVAQLIMRDHNQGGHIRSVVLDSPAPVTVAAMADTPAQLSASMVRLFQQCAADLLCRAAYPNLDTVYRQVMLRLESSPVTLPAVNPGNGESFTFQFGLAEFGFYLQYGAYRLLPGLIYDVFDGDYTFVIKDREKFVRDSQRANAGQHFGFRTSMNCNEPWQTISPAQQAAMARYPEAVFMDNRLDVALCQQWPSFTPPQQTLAAGDTPTLILTGQYDTRLPAAYGELIAASLSRAFHFQAPRASHLTLDSGGPCPNLMVLAFFEDPTHPPASDCLTASASGRFDTQFVIRAAAMRGPVQAALWLMNVGLVVLMVETGVKARRYHRSGLRFGFAGLLTLRVIGWLPLISSVILVGLTYYAGQTHLLPINPVNAVALIVPIVTAVQAAYLFSPEDEPALEVILAMPRPPAWTLLERLLALFAMQGVVALMAGLYLTSVTGESLTLALSRWLPPTLLLAGIALIVTLAVRRAIFGVLVVCLLWIVLALFGDFVIAHWPIAWPLHLYLSPAEPEYLLNRIFSAISGVFLIGVVAAWLLRSTERLLLGPQKVKRQSKSKAIQAATELAPVREIIVRPQPVVLSQLAAIIRYEFQLQWRRAVLPALAIGLLMTPIIGAVVAYSDFRGYRAALASGTLSPEVAQAEITAAMIPMIWLGAYLIATIMVPLIVADTIPKDKQVGIRELLDTLPLSSGAYLGGKLLSLWLSLFVVIILVMLISGSVWWFVIGPFDITLFLEVWVVGITWLVLINAGLSMLLAAGQPSTRRATLVGAGYVLLCLVGVSFAAAAATRPGWWHGWNPARPLILLYYLLGFPGAVSGYDDWTRAGVALVQQAATRQAVLGSLAAGLAQVGVVGLVVWGAMRSKR